MIHMMDEDEIRMEEKQIRMEEQQIQILYIYIVYRASERGVSW